MSRKYSYTEIVTLVNSFGFKLVSTNYINNKTPLRLKCKYNHVFERSINNLLKNANCPICKTLEKYNEINNFITSHGFKLLTAFNDFIKLSQPLKIRCKKGHIFFRSYSNFVRNATCPVCKLENLRVGLETVKKELASFGYEVLSDVYVNNKVKLKLKCPAGHICYISYNHFKLGVRCDKCKNERKWTYDKVKKYIELNGDKLLSKKYISSKHKLTICCKNGHVYKIKFNDYRNGHRCAKCAGNKKLTYKEVCEYFAKYNYSILSTEYINSNAPLIVKCSRGHIYSTTFSRFKQGHRCPICSVNERRYSHTYVKKEIERHGYKLLSKYINSRSKIKLLCPKGHVFLTTWNYFQVGNRCPKCAITISRAEKQISEYLTKLGYDVELHNRNILYNPDSNRYLELDIYLPTLKKAIEFNGTYWHSRVDAKKRDRLKIKLSKEIGIKLLIIEESAWKIDVNIIFNYIDMFLMDKFNAAVVLITNCGGNVCLMTL